MAESSERPGLFRRLLGKGADEEKVRTVRFPLQAYGKLPIYKDFISVGLTDPAAREFRQWIDRGFSYRWAENEEYRDAEIPQHGFLLRLPESKACVAGSLWGSSDEGGLRRFPFVAFLSFAAAQPAADPLAAVHYLSALERRCEEIRNGFASGASLSAFYKAYRGAQFECAIKTREQGGRELRDALGNFPLGDFAESLFGGNALSRWPVFVAELERAVLRPDGPGAVRLPLGGVMPRAREIAFWLRWLDRLEARCRRPLTGVLYSSGRGPGRAVLFFRDLAPEDFLLLHPTHGGHAQVADVGLPEQASALPPAEVIPASTASPDPPAADAPAPEPAPSPAAAVFSPSPGPEPPGASPAGAATPESAVPQLQEATAVDPAAAPATPAAAAAEEPPPFPEAEAPPEAAGQIPRETFSSLVIPAALLAAPMPGVDAQPQAAAESSPAALALPEAPAERAPEAQPEAKVPAESSPPAEILPQAPIESAPVVQPEPQPPAESAPVAQAESNPPSGQQPPSEVERPAAPPVPAGWNRPLCALIGLE